MDDKEPCGFRLLKNGDLEPIHIKSGYIYSAAFILCKECREVISGMGGPANNALCPSCADNYRLVKFVEGKPNEV